MSVHSLSIDVPSAALLVSALARSGGLVAAAPVLGDEATPATVKVLVTLGLAFAVLPPAAVSVPAPPPGMVGAVVLLAAEAAVGAVIGLAARAILSAAEGAGEILGYQSGVSIGQVLDPLSGHLSNPVGFLQNMVAVQAFLAAGGLGWMVLALAGSYRVVPPLGGFGSAAPWLRLASLGGVVLEGALLLLAPAIVAAVLVDLLLLTVGRAAPAIQLMVVALPVKVWVGIALLAALTLHHAPTLAWLMARTRSEIGSVLGLVAPWAS